MGRLETSVNKTSRGNAQNNYLRHFNRELVDVDEHFCTDTQYLLENKFSLNKSPPELAAVKNIKSLQKRL